MRAWAAWLLAGAVTACGAAADMQLRQEAPLVVVPPAVAPRPVVALPPPVVEDLPTAAFALDGDLRLQEPPRSRERRAADDRVHPLVMPLQERPHPRIASHARGSISVGTVTAGYLVDGAELEESGRHHRVLTHAASRHTRFTTDEMRKLLLCAAEKVAREHPGFRLGLGNLARKGGGLLPWSVSHHNGRDADVAFYARKRNGKPAEPDHLYHFNRRLQATDAPEPLEFDVPANWTLVKALVTGCQGAELQRLFIAAWLKAPLIEYAKQQKEDKAIIGRVASILAQPRRALPHNDHLHLRIACAADDVNEGCLDASRAPLAAVGAGSGVRARLPAIRKALVHGSPALRAGAAALLATYRDDEAAPILLKALVDPEPMVRRAAIAALVDLQPPGLADRLDAALDLESDPGVLTVGLRALAALDVWRVQRRFQDQRVVTAPADSLDLPSVTVRRLAVELLSESGNLDVARATVPLLADADAGVRNAARYTLGRIALHRTEDVALALGSPLPAQGVALHGLGAGLHGLVAGAQAEIEAATEASLWHQFFERLPAGTDRETLALGGLQRQGYAVLGLDRSALPELVRALSAVGPVRDDAARFIEKIVQFRPVQGRGARSQPAAFWSEWLVQKRLIPAQVLAAAPGGASPALANDAD